MGSEKETGGDFRFEATLRPGEDPKEAETRWYRWDEEENRWELYGNHGPSWDELSEGARETLGRVYGFVLEKHREKELREAAGRDADPEG